jgi:hypothetical protein
VQCYYITSTTLGYLVVIHVNVRVLYCIVLYCPWLENPTAFELTRIDKKMKKYIICANSPQEKAEWIKAIMEQHDHMMGLQEASKAQLLRTASSAAMTKQPTS